MSKPAGTDMEAQALQRLVDRKRKVAGIEPPSVAPRRVPASLQSLRINPPSPSTTPGRTIEEMEREAIMEKRRGRWRHCGIPARHRAEADKREEHGEPWLRARRTAIGIVRANGIAALVGERGTGKTQMSASIVRELVIGDGWTAQYHRTADLLGRFKRQVFGEGEDEFTFLAKLSRIRVLVLDEFQDRYESETEDTILHRIIDHRYGAMVGTIIIANLTPDALAESVGSSAWDRMRESGVVIPCKWNGYRGEKA